MAKTCDLTVAVLTLSYPKGKVSNNSNSLQRVSPINIQVLNYQIK